MPIVAQGAGDQTGTRHQGLGLCGTHRPTRSTGKGLHPSGEHLHTQLLSPGGMKSRRHLRSEDEAPVTAS